MNFAIFDNPTIATTTPNLPYAQQTPSNLAPDVFALPKLTLQSEWNLKFQTLGRVYPVTLILMLIMYAVIWITTMLLLISFGLFNPRFFSVSRKLCLALLIIVLDSFLGMLIALWGVIDYRRGSLHNQPIFATVLTGLMIMNIFALGACLMWQIRALFVGLLCFLLLIKMYLWRKSNEMVFVPSVVEGQPRVHVQ